MGSKKVKYGRKTTDFSDIKKKANRVKAKKHLGQHFLKDELIAKKIGETLTLQGYRHVLEIGPGTGVLTKYLLLKDIDIIAMDLDKESIEYLHTSFFSEHPELLNRENSFQIVEADFLKYDFDLLFKGKQVAITGNFPYNISSQIVFKTLEHKDRIPEFTGMFQKEVAKRICEKEGSKIYGVISVLTQAFYEAEYLFTVPPEVFDPPPKVHSGVIRLTRKKEPSPVQNEKLLFTVVKSAFGQRRKTLKNSLKTLIQDTSLFEQAIFTKRPEQLSVASFVELTALIENQSNSSN